MLHWLAAGARPEAAGSAGTIRVALLADDALDRAMAWARGSAEAAEALALDLGAPRVAGLVRQDAERLETVPGRLWASTWACPRSEAGLRD